jgi:hypothetical protein
MPFSIPPFKDRHSMHNATWLLFMINNGNTRRVEQSNSDFIKKSNLDQNIKSKKKVV